MEYSRSVAVVIHLALVIHSSLAQHLPPNGESEAAFNTSILAKKNRFLTFNNDDGEIKIELDFSVPFIHIPIGKRSNTGSIHPTLNINTRGIVTVGAMVFLFVAIVPKLIQIFIPQAYGGSLDGIVPFMARIDEALQGQDFKSLDCYSKAACWMGDSIPLSQPISSILRTSSWIRNMIPADSIYSAIVAGSQGNDCSAYKCPLSAQNLSKLIRIWHSGGHHP